MARSAEKSTFAVTCTLLSQYIKHKGGIADLALGIAPRPHETPKAEAEKHRTPTTMSLLPGVDVSPAAEKKDGLRSGGREMELFPQRSGFGPSDGARQTSDTREPQRGQLTIFYGGKVLMFDEFPAEKARDLIQLASKGSAACPHNFGFAPPSSVPASVPEAANGPAVQSSTAVPVPPSSLLGNRVHAQKPGHPTVSDLPIARKASLHCFLEKRKDRLNAKAPYQVSPLPVASPAKEGSADLGWGSASRP